MDHLKSVLVGIDFTESSRTVLKQGLRLASPQGAKVDTFHIVDIVVSIDVGVAMGMMTAIANEQLLAEAGAEWTRFQASVPRAEHVKHHAEVNGRIYGMLRFARSLKPDLLIIGARDSRPDTGFGTIAAAAVREGPCDVLLVREHQTGPFKSIVVAVDFSEHSRRALERAIQIAQHDSSSLHIIHVYTPPSCEMGFSMRGIDLSVQRERSLAETLERRLQGICKPYEGELSALNPTIALHYHDGHRSGLSSYAEKIGADLLVLGTRGRSNVRDMLLGSTAEKVLRQAHCSVLAIRAV
jgi:universal stress protein E